MRMEYDPERDLLYLLFGGAEEKAARTEKVTPGVHVDFDRKGKLLGIEVLEASTIMEDNVQFNVSIKPYKKISAV